MTDLTGEAFPHLCTRSKPSVRHASLGQVCTQVLIMSNVWSTAAPTTSG
jgi:hypothetical protein